jgi:hypothetical protein
MIEGNARAGYTLTCDHCEEELEFDDFPGAVAYKKEEGWKSVKSCGGTWFELCPDCQSPEIIKKYRETA